MDINQTYCGDHFTIYTNIESLCCTPETYIIFYVNLPQYEKGKDLPFKKNKKAFFGEFPGGPVVRSRALGSIPGWGTKIPQAAWHGQKNPTYLAK